MWTDYLLRFLYVITFASIGILYYLSKRQQRSLRQAVDDFAFTFVKIANAVIPGQTKRRVSADSLKAAMTSAVTEPVIQLYHRLEEAAYQVRKACGRSKKLRQQMAEPVQDMFDMTRAFLVFCEKSGEVQTPEQKKLVNRYIYRQPEHRRELLRRISRDAIEEYDELNAGYDLG